MSDFSPQREWRFYIEDMIGFADKVLAYTAGLNQDDFVSDDLTYDATLRNLELIGEAATRIPDEVRAMHTEIPCRRSRRRCSGRRCGCGSGSRRFRCRGLPQTRDTSWAGVAVR